MAKFRLICLICLGLCFLLTAEGEPKSGKGKADDEEDDEEDDASAPQKPAVVGKPVVAPPPPSGDAVSDTELTRALDNVGQVIDAIVKEGQSDLTYDPIKAASDADTDDVIAAKLTRITQDLIKVFSDTNQVPDDASDGVDDSVKLEKTVQEILTAFGEPGGEGGDVAENLLSTVDDILKFYNDETASASVPQQPLAPPPPAPSVKSPVNVAPAGKTASTAAPPPVKPATLKPATSKPSDGKVPGKGVTASGDDEEDDE